MAEEFRAVPPQVRRVAGNLHDVGSEHLRVASDLRAEVGEGGDALSSGDARSFWEQFNWLTGSVEGQGDWLKGLADNLAGAGDSFQASDDEG
jgi:hypothetical protein